MKKFTYSLAGVLRVRRIQEQQKRADVARATAEKNKVTEEIERLANEVLASKKRLQGAGRVDVGDYRLNEQYLQGVQIRSQELDKKLKMYDIQLANLKKELQLKILETKKLETHHDKEKLTWKEDAAKEEQAEFDDIANSRRR
jgi:flagellar export protein FliJ